MAWFGPRGNCGCCNIILCDCRNRPESARRFARTPTVKVVIDIHTDSITYAMNTLGFSFPNSRYDEFEISGMTSLSGTYYFDLSKTAAGCIDEHANSSEVINIGSVTVERTRRAINLTTCVISGAPVVTTETSSIGLIVKTEWGYMLPPPSSVNFPHLYAQLFKSWSTDFAVGFSAASATSCSDDYIIKAPGTGNTPNYNIYSFMNTGKVQTDDAFSIPTDCGSVSGVSMEWGDFTVTIEDI
jgi:hypothetical protein